MLHQTRASLIGLLTTLALVACGDPPTDPTSQESVDLARNITGVEVLTYDNSGQAVHPDIALSPSWWTGPRAYLGITPYPGGNVRFENPSLFAAVDGSHWKVPVGGS